MLNDTTLLPVVDIKMTVQDKLVKCYDTNKVFIVQLQIYFHQQTEQNNSTSHKVGKIKINRMNNPCTTEDVEI